MSARTSTHGGTPQKSLNVMPPSTAAVIACATADEPAAVAMSSVIKT